MSIMLFGTYKLRHIEVRRKPKLESWDMSQTTDINYLRAVIKGPKLLVAPL